MSTIKEKSLFDICQEKGIITVGKFYEFIAGKKVRVIPCITPSSHNYSKEFIFRKLPALYTSTGTLSRTTQLSNVECVSTDKTYTLGAGKGFIYPSELTINVITKSSLQENLNILIDESKKQIAELEQKISILEELDMEEYDEKLISIVNAVGVINKDAKPKEKLQLAEALMVALDK